LLLTVVLIEAGILYDVSHVSSISVLAPHPLVVSREDIRCFVYIVTTCIVVTLISSPVATTHITIGVGLDFYFRQIIVITLIIALGHLKAGINRDIPNVAVDTIKVTVDPLSAALET
jgi:hypothetical protein